MISFTQRHFKKEMIVMLVRWYVAYALSYRDIEELASERGPKVDYSTIRPPDPDEFKLPLIYKLTANLSPEKSYLFHSSPHKDAAKLCPKHDLRGDVI